MNTEYINLLRKEYINRHIINSEFEELVKENNIEARDVRGYHGREIFELVQNADDAYQKSIDQGERPSEELDITISYSDNVLSVANSGTFFDKPGIRSILQGNNSSKSGRYLGNKGTGFRSILNWASEIKIFSGEFAIKFSEKIAGETFNEYRNHPQIAKQLKNHPKLHFSMLALPENITHDRNPELTTVEITTIPEKAGGDFGVREQLKEIDLNILLFLPNTATITIRMENEETLYRRSFLNQKQIGNILESQVELSRIENGETVSRESYLLFSKTIPNALKIEDEDKDIKLAVAIPENYYAGQNHLYSYFPLLDTDSPFECVMHATYQLTDQRNTITKGENKTVVKEQLEFLVEIATRLIEEGMEEKAYRLLLPVNIDAFTKEPELWRFNSSFGNYRLEDYFLNKLKECPLFKTVNGKPVSLQDNPKYIEGRFPKRFKGKAFSNLIAFSEDSNRGKLIWFLEKRLGLNLAYSPEELCRIINETSGSWPIGDRVDVFIWWNEYWKQQGKTEVLPHLLRDSRGSWVEAGKTYYFLDGDFAEVKIPRWVKKLTLDNDCQKILESKVKRKYGQARSSDGNIISIPRMICRDKLLPCVDFKYTDRTNIITLIDESVDGRYNRGVEFVKWLWKYCRDRFDDGKTQDWEKIWFPTAEGTVMRGENLYFGEEYGNHLSAELFRYNGAYKPLAPPETFNIAEADRAEFIRFVGRFRVKTWPPIKLSILSPIQKYDGLVKNKIKSTVSYFNENSRIYHMRYTLEYIEGLPEILKELSTADILKWVWSDANLMNHLRQKYKINGKIEYQGDNQRRLWEFYEMVPNYILFCFNHIPWIEINGERCAPASLINGFRHTGNKKFSNELPVITEPDLEQLARELQTDYETVEDLLGIFDIARRITDLESNEFYGLLLRIPEMDSGREIINRIYGIVEQSDFKTAYPESPNKKDFFKEGKLLVKLGGEKRFHKALDSYLPSTKIVDRKRYPIVDKGLRTNNDNFIKIFGCRRFEGDYSVKEGTEERAKKNDWFQQYWDNFVKYAIPFAENKNENIARSLDNLSVALVRSVEIIEDGEEKRISEPFVPVRKDMTHWFIVADDSVEETSGLINPLSEVVEQIFDNIANSPGFDVDKIGEIFRAGESDRRFLIQKYCGSLDVMECDTGTNRREGNFREALEKLGLDGKELIETYGLDFTNYQSHGNTARIIRLLQDNKIDVEDLRNAGFNYRLDVREYWQTELRRTVREEKEKFKDYFFTRAKNDERLQPVFMKTVEEFENFAEEFDVPDSVNFNPETELVGRFGEWRTLENLDSADKTYDLNFIAMNPEYRYADLIRGSRDVMTMIYFKRDTEFQNWLDNQGRMPKVADREEENPENYKHVRAEKMDFTDSPFRDDSGNEGPNRRKKPGKGIFSREAREQKEKNQKQRGNKAELIIYNTLVEKYGEQNVRRHSEAFEELKLLSPGLARSGDYDLSFTDEEGNTYLIEVKTGEGNIFYMSPGELDFAQQVFEEKGKVKYRVYFVYDLDSPHPKYTELPEEFWAHPSFSQRAIIETIEFKMPPQQ